MTDIATVPIPGGPVPLAAAVPGGRRTVLVQPFELAAVPVTERLLAELIGIQDDVAERPATGVSWLRAVRTCNAASEWEGLDPVYRFDGEDVHWDVETDGFRLPTEAEWELACRAGTTGPRYGAVAEIAWTAADGVGGPQPVGRKTANAFGLFDTLGNVWEWCWDLLDAEADDRFRVLRGGGWGDDPSTVRAGVRRGAPPRLVLEDAGVRLARGPFVAPTTVQGRAGGAERGRHG